MPFPAQELLRCPVCSGPWAASPDGAGGRSLVCASGHRFDAARQGYVNFLTGRGTRFVPDTAEMVAARERFLGAGYYAPIAQAVADAAAPALSGPGGPTDDGAGARRALSPAVLDAGAGTGYYLGAVLARSPGASAVALDLSRHALARAAKLPRTAAVVWDLWRDLPLPDRSVDVVLDVFAPRNLREYARVLRPRGVLCIVTPRPEHLAGLRDLLPMLDVPAGKAEGVARAAEQDFEAGYRRAIEFPLVLDRDAAADLALMGPAGHHTERAVLLAKLPAGPLETEGAVELSVLRRR
ncbi:methyltransferase domain-containing protein [Sinomonas sp. ASV322]|uniref:methyltransferase domain-containing protein n=1 Tax=Sinomonas sp. ASV322 TaxID=3041920 RepID=UPI0027DBDD10|nr:methyltransferase domain-containing protein [Sinomonas sp. ASV322]MDQ4501048.1 methyltransferase domain-containing protein [Sinomonas sp. ASV322]